MAIGWRLGLIAKRARVDLIGGGNAGSAGSRPWTLEPLVSDAVALNWLVVQEANMAAANLPGGNLTLATSRLRRWRSCGHCSRGSSR